MLYKNFQKLFEEILKPRLKAGVFSMRGEDVYRPLRALRISTLLQEGTVIYTGDIKLSPVKEGVIVEQL